MRERPILFSTPMVQAIRSGQKTQTRRVMRRQPDAVEYFKRGEETTDTNAKYAILRCYNNPKGFKRCASGWSADASYKTPFREFNVGDLLWVRESWYQKGSVGRSYPDDDEYQFFGARQAAYVADGDAPQGWTVRKRPSIHMPRWASRIQLEITKIRIERLQDISEEDAIAEGMLADDDYCAEEKFSILWNQINGWAEKGWNANPWVWVVEFKVIQGGEA
ncbi:hypothetical protein [Acinetobacter sp. Ac_5812]|uniref:hypothetical protein n=1 Tax=Acinetobacter sp. Ac_5812 TaxID=1848937 RepID=UPI0014906B23|nr:hypothetical protein [Acinetobacter sp. Ac_5812]NNP70434.1 hypothetical protein [Acinetobacter sp. Ac_5812]